PATVRTGRPSTPDRRYGHVHDTDHRRLDRPPVPGPDLPRPGLARDRVRHDHRCGVAPPTGRPGTARCDPQAPRQTIAWQRCRPPRRSDLFAMALPHRRVGPGTLTARRDSATTTTNSTTIQLRQVIATVEP